MSKWALPAAVAILAISFSSSAQERKASGPSQPEQLTLSQAGPNEMVEGPVTLQGTSPFRTLNNVWRGSGPLTLVDGRLFSFPSAFGWVEATSNDFLPAFTTGTLPQTNSLQTMADDGESKEVDLLHQFDYVGGEVGVFYGRSTGKFRREVTQGYILGEIVDGNTHIIVGGSYGHSSGKTPRIIGR